MAVILAGAAALRLTGLDIRPMHCDEANQAIKFGRLLEQGECLYDPREHHGPSLNLLTLPIARVASARKLTEVTETHLRLVPAVFGIVLVGLVWLVRRELGHAAVVCAALLTAVSPAMVFYSRYYIQEMLLVCFTFAAVVALWRYAREVTDSRSEETQARRRSLFRQTLWLVLLGLCVGMMHATKETCVITLLAMLLAGGLTMRRKKVSGTFSAQYPWGRPGKRFLTPFWFRLVLPGVVVVLTAAGVSALLFSSFLNKPQAVLDSLSTYFYYFGRASGEGSVGRHVYPWPYYFRILFWWHRPGGPVWTEASIAALALVGLVAGAWGKGLNPASLPMVRFLGVYTVLMTVVYSALPYKTPWCALGFFHGMILLAGVGATVLVRVAPGYVLKATAVTLLAAAAGHLAWQAYRASFVAYEDADNPYVYAHTTGDVPRLAQRVRQIAAVHPHALAMHIQVICPDDDHWPLPWYLRGFSRVDWFPGIPRGRAAPFIITQPEMEPSLSEYLYEKQPPGQRYLYVPVLPDGEDRDWQLRGHVPLRAYVRLDLWDTYQAAQTEGPSS